MNVLNEVQQRGKKKQKPTVHQLVFKETITLAETWTDLFLIHVHLVLLSVLDAVLSLGGSKGCRTADVGVSTLCCSQG